MLCPVCKSTSLDRKELILGLQSYHCKSCSGNWIRYEDYTMWKSKGGINVFRTDVKDETYIPEYDSKQACLCPDCGRILVKYRVASGLPFSLDYCGTCNGVWLDKSEWEELVEGTLQYNLNEISTGPWQNKIRKELTKQGFEDIYTKKFGKESYEKLKETRAWLRNTGKCSEMISYLMDEDPYKL